MNPAQILRFLPYAGRSALWNQSYPHLEGLRVHRELHARTMGYIWPEYASPPRACRSILSNQPATDHQSSRSTSTSDSTTAVPAILGGDAALESHLWMQQPRPTRSTIPLSLPDSFTHTAKANTVGMVTACHRAAIPSDTVRTRVPILENEDPPVICYEGSVILDSGTTDHMVPHERYVTHVQPAYSTALMPDNSVLPVTKKGILRVSVYCRDAKKRTNIALLDALVVDGFRVILWSVPCFAMQGHHISFEYNSVKLTFNVNEPRCNQLVLNIAHPYFWQVQGPRSQLSHVAVNMVETRSQRRNQPTVPRRAAPDSRSDTTSFQPN